MSSKRLGKGLRDQLRVHQVLAERHYWQRLRSPGLVLPSATPVCGDPVPNPPAQNSVHCPFCALRKPFDELSIEHGPQQGGQSRLGADVVAVLCCKRCNNDSKYEADAAAIARGDEADELEELTADELARLTERRKLLEQIVEVDVEVVPLVYELTDLKAAFTVAFAVLGYRFALPTDMRDIREAMVKGTRPDPDRVQVVKFKDGAPAAGGVVLEVGEPAPCVIVISSTGYGVVLPMPGAQVIPPLDTLKRLKARRYEWPPIAAHAKVNEVDRAYRAGTLFHGDLCHRHQFSTDGTTLQRAAARHR